MLTLQDAKNRFSAVVEAALAGRPQAVSRRGKPAVVVVSVAEYERLRKLAGSNGTGFIDHLASFPAHEDEFDRTDVKPRDVSF